MRGNIFAYTNKNILTKGTLLNKLHLSCLEILKLNRPSSQSIELFSNVSVKYIKIYNQY